MRVTDQIVFRQATNDIVRLRSELYCLQQQGSTGEKFQSIEEDPTAAARIRMLTEAYEATRHFEKNITRSRTQLEAGDSVLGEATNLLIRAKEIALAMSNDTVGADERTIVADEVESLFDSMLGVANTNAGGDYIFSGFQTDQRPFQADGTFVGDNGVKEVDVGPGSRLAVNVSGEDAFTVSGGIDVFAEIEALRLALATNDTTGIMNAIDTMDQAMNQVTRARTGAGLKLNQLDVASAVRDRLEDSLVAEKSELIDIDPVKVFLEIGSTARALEDAIAVSQKVMSISILGG